MSLNVVAVYDLANVPPINLSYKQSTPLIQIKIKYRPFRNTENIAFHLL